MENKLYVGNLSYNATDEDLRELFELAGTVKSVTVMRDRDTGRSRGFAFVEMESDEEAQKAISLFNERDFHERALTVNVARRVRIVLAPVAAVSVAVVVTAVATVAVAVGTVVVAVAVVIVAVAAVVIVVAAEVSVVVKTATAIVAPGNPWLHFGWVGL